MNARLVSYKEGNPDLTFFLNPSGTGIGRDAGNLVQLVSSEVSRRHAVLQQIENDWHIQDLGSKNGIIVNGKRVRKASLKKGDTVTIGPFSLAFEIDPPGSRCKPVHVLEMTSTVNQRTMFASKLPKQ